MRNTLTETHVRRPTSMARVSTGVASAIGPRRTAVASTLRRAPDGPDELRQLTACRNKKGNHSHDDDLSAAHESHHWFR